MTTFANCIWRLLLDELVGGSCECGSALTLTLFDCFAATTHRQRSQNVRNQVECLRTKGRQRDGGVYS